MGLINFIKGYYSTNEKYGLKGNEFKHVKYLLSFISGHIPTKDYKIS